MVPQVVKRKDVVKAVSQLINEIRTGKFKVNPTTPEQALASSLKVTRKIVRLSFMEKRKLAEIIEKEYVSRQESDKDFTAYAKTVLDFEFNADHVSHLRSELSIPLTSLRGEQTRLDRIEARLLFLEKAVKEAGIELK